MKIISYLDISKMWSFDFDDVFVPEIFWSLVIMFLMIIFSIFIKVSFTKAIKDPLAKPNKFQTLCIMGVRSCENLVVEVMGEKNRGFAAYICVLFPYLFLSFIWGLTGFSSPVTYFGVPLSLALVTFVLIHAEAVKVNKWKYFQRYIDPFPIFLPINLVSMWAPLISLSLRLFGNAISGYCIMTILYFGLENLSSIIFTGEATLGPQSIVLAPIITPVLHLYFDLFSGFIQTFVFSMLTMINVLQEQNDDSEIENKVETLKVQN